MTVASSARSRAPQVEHPPRPLVIAAFAAVYILWGSTYLAIRFAVESLPPLLMAAARFLVAGSVLYGVMAIRGRTEPVGAREWRAAFAVGALLLLGGNGLVVWAEQTVESGVASLLVATAPAWMVLFEWMRPTGDRPTWRVWVGLVLGFVGIAVLAGPGEWAGGAVDPLGAAALVLASITWSAGAIYSRAAPLPGVRLQSAAMQMIAGSALLFVASAITGEFGSVDVSAFTWKSVAAWVYLIVFGSLIGFSAYTWLLQVSTPARVSTTSYVNPVVAVILGWLIAGEAVTPRVAVAAVVIIAGVIAMIARPRRPAPPIGIPPSGVPTRGERKAPTDDA